jgi:hypothetical protein
MSALVIAIIMVCISGICLSRALSHERRMRDEDRRAFLIFCGTFGAASVFQGLLTTGDPLLLGTRTLAGVMLLAGAAIVFRRNRGKT